MGKGVPVTMTHTLQKANASVFLLILVTTGTACSNPLNHITWQTLPKKKEVLTIAISLDLSSDLCRHRYCLLKPATWSIILDCKTCRHEIWILESLELFSDLFRDWDCLVFADKTIRLYKSSKYRLPSHCVTKASIFFPILIATGTACSNSLYLLNHIWLQIVQRARGVPVTMALALQKANASVFLLILVTAGAACLNQLLNHTPLQTLQWVTRRSRTYHHDTCIEKNEKKRLSLSSCLFRGWDCLLKPTAQSYSTANFAKKKESSASHPDTCFAKCLDLSFDLCPH